MVKLTWIGDRVLNEDEIALIQNALVCYEQQLRVDEREAEIAAVTYNLDVRDAMLRLKEAHAATQRRVNRLLEKIG